MEPQMRMDPSWRKLRSYSGTANTQRKHALQSPTSDGRPSSLDIRGLPITTWKLTGLTRVSPCLNALLSVKDSQTEAWRRMLDQEAQKAEVSWPLKDMVPAQYHNFRDVFSKEAFDELPPQKVWDHAIDLSPGIELPHSRTFPLSPAEQKELDDFLWENLANGHIHPSKSPMGAPVFFVKKKDGLLRLVQDYWKLNEIMVKNSYPLPLVSNILTCLHDTKFFTMLD